MKKNPMGDFSVVICAYTEERWADLLRSVESIRQQTRPPVETILVVDHNPALYARARERLSDVTVLENREAPGLSGSRNTGLLSARGDFVAFLDEDAWAAPDWLEQLYTGYSTPQVSGVGGSIEPSWDSGRPAWFPEEFLWVVGCSYLGLPRQSSPVRNLIGANMSFRRDLFNAVGGFRTGIGRIRRTPVGCEETEFCIRARQRNPESVWLYLPEARVRHRVPTNRSRFAYFLARCYSEGLSKALVTRLVGARDSLQSERVYTLRILPRGVLRGLSDGLFRQDLGGWARSAAILVGLAFTTAGYLAGLLFQGGAILRKRLPFEGTGAPRTSR